MKQPNKRLPYFDQMKGIAILLVVVGHVMQFAFGFEQSSVVKMLGIFHMPVFFYISGFFMYKEFPDVKQLLYRLGKRTLNLLVPYCVFAALWCKFADSNFISLLLEGGGRYWFLWDLFVLSVFFMLYGYLLQKVKHDWIYVALWILPYGVLMALKIFHLEAVLGNNGMLNLGHMVSYYRYFLIGYLCARYTRFNTWLFKNNWVYAFSFVAFFLQWYLCDLHHMLLIFAGGMGAIIVMQRLLMSAENEHSASMSLLGRMGVASIHIYVIHYFFIPDVSALVHEGLCCENAFIWQLTFALLMSIPIIAASMLVGRLIKLNKYLNLVFLGKTF